MPLLITDKYHYLGVHLDEHLNYKATGNKLSEAATRATGKLVDKGLGIKTYSVLYISPVYAQSWTIVLVLGLLQNEKLDILLSHNAMLLRGEQICPQIRYRR